MVNPASEEKTPDGVIVIPKDGEKKEEKKDEKKDDKKKDEPPKTFWGKWGYTIIVSCIGKYAYVRYSHIPFCGFTLSPFRFLYLCQT